MAGPAAAGGAEIPPLSGGALGLTAFALALGTFMQVLDSTIANVSLPTIAGNLGVSSDNATWVITSFAVANGVAVPLTGWLMGRYGVVRTFTVSVILFTIASFLCGIAWNLSSLIAFRVIQGAVSGPMIPGSQALLISIFPPHKRATALGIWSMTTLVAPIMGPILGGFISDNYHWSWIFLINLPVGLFCAAVSWFSLSSRETPTRKLPIDSVGLGLLVVWVGALQMVLDLGKNDDWFNSPRIVIMTVVCAVGFISWLIWELTEKHPAIDLSLFKERNFLIGTIALCAGYALFFGAALLLPLWLQTQMGYTATWAGLVAAPSGAVAVLLTPFAAKLSTKIDVRWLATVAFVAFAASYFMRAGYTTYADFYSLTLPMLVQGISMGTFFLAMVTIALGGVPPEKLPSATGISNFARITAGSFAASLITTFWDRREALHQSRMVEGLNHLGGAYPYAANALGALGPNETQAAAIVTRQVVGQAYLLSLTDIFWACGWAMLVVTILVWFTKRPPAPTGPVAAD
ncbi:DHA2 family efflux MFS transporter permease subunit [Sphingomonas montanisoli]|uniref:DHA2 family efflux MFS transporter permease subunit n=1 Tax=Sphingomonas montanisoli TaxID=2606412 RepID=A0A5D9C254_9SPHN|nr:DHA2 family efflux MFS transporter permease subunit [Sphingomonas montanisoli]TZG25918.1 DHA2 family efflux MFS transporter permease subunit [Sphingomonas montanisoli]